MIKKIKAIHSFRKILEVIIFNNRKLTNDYEDLLSKNLLYDRKILLDFQT